MNNSLSDGVVPFRLKRAKIISFHKSGDKTIPAIFRRIAILSHVNKVLVKTLFSD